MKIQKYLRKILIIMSLLFIVNEAKSQNSCSSAIDISTLKIDSTILCSNTGSKYWFKITTYYSNYIFIIDTPA